MSSRLPLLLFVLCACDPGYRVRGTVMTASGEPLQGAVVKFPCGHVYPSTTDVDGGFATGMLGCWETKCEAELSWPDGGMIPFTAAPTCHDSTWMCGKGTCTDMEWKLTTTRP